MTRLRTIRSSGRDGGNSNRLRVVVTWALVLLVGTLGLLVLLDDPGVRSSGPATGAVETAPVDPDPSRSSRDPASDVDRRAAVDAPAADPIRRLQGRVLCVSTHKPVAARIGTGREAIFSSPEHGRFAGTLTVGSGAFVTVGAPGFVSRRLEITDGEWSEVRLQPRSACRVTVRRPNDAAVAGAEVWTTFDGARASLGVTDAGGEVDIPTGRPLLLWAESGGSISTVQHVAPGSSTELVLADGGGRIGVRDAGGEPASDVLLRVARIDANARRTDNDREAATGADGLTPALPYGTYLVSSASDGMAVVGGPSSGSLIRHRKAHTVRLSAATPTAWIEAVVLPSLTIRVVDENGTPWTGAVQTWTEGPSAGDRSGAVRALQPDAAGFLSVPFRNLDGMRADSRLCLTADGKTVTRVLVSVARQRPPPEAVLRDAADLVDLRLRTAEGDPVDFPLRILDMSGLGWIEVFSGIPPVEGVRLAWHGGDVRAVEIASDGSLSWPLGGLSAEQVSRTGPNELILERTGTLVVDVPTTLAGPLFCSLHPGSRSRVGRRIEGRVVFERLPPGEYAVGSRGWVESAILRWSHVRLGPVANAVRVDAGGTTHVPWDPAWGRTDVTGSVASTGVDPGQLLVYPIYAGRQFPVSLAPFSRCGRVREDGGFVLSDLDGRPEYLLIARIDDSGAIVPYARCDPGASAQVSAGEVVVRVTGVETAQEVRCAYEPRVPGTQLYQDVHFVTRRGTSDGPVELRAVPAWVDEIHVRIGDRLEKVPVRVVPGQRIELVVPW